MNGPRDERVTARVLLVDDHEDSREMLAEFLRLAGFEVGEFGSAEDALASLADGGGVPAAVITDLTLPGEDGHALARRLRAAEATARIPVVAVTGHSPDGSAGWAHFDRVLTKPVDPARIVTLLRSLVSGSLPNE